jgi:hypothetical protein
VSEILRIATELASKLGESPDSGKVEVDARVAFLRDGRRGQPLLGPRRLESCDF